MKSADNFIARHWTETKIDFTHATKKLNQDNLFKQNLNIAFKYWQSPLCGSGTWRYLTIKTSLLGWLEIILCIICCRNKNRYHCDESKSLDSGFMIFWFWFWSTVNRWYHRATTILSHPNLSLFPQQYDVRWCCFSQSFTNFAAIFV